VGAGQPLDGLHTPGTMQGSAVVQVTVVPPPHIPAVQVSPVLHMLPLLHAPAEQATGHMPSTHELGQAAPLFVQVPVASHSCG